MKKSILQFSVIAAIAASMTLTTSCSSDDSAEVYVPEPVVFNAGMSGIATTRAAVWEDDHSTISDQWSEGVKVNIYTKEADNSTFANKTYVSDATNTQASIAGGNKYYTKLVGDGVDSDPSAAFYWASATDSKEIRAWTFGNTVAPGDIATHDGSAWNLNTLEFTLDGANSATAQTNKELLYVWGDYAKATSGSSAGSLIFKHQLAKVTIRIYAQKTKVTKCTLGSSQSKTEANSIPITGVFTQPQTSNSRNKGDDGIWDTETSFPEYDTGTKYGYITPQTVESNQSPSLNTTSDLTSTADNTKYSKRSIYEAVILPGDYQNKELFEITYDGARYVYKPTSTHSIEKGKHYTYKVIVKDAALDVYAAIAPWTPVSNAPVDAELQ